MNAIELQECQLDETLASIDKPLIGLEYVAELQDLNARVPRYVCILCDKQCDFGNIIAHVTSHRHRMKYLDSNFPVLMAILNRNHRFNTDMTYREEVLTHIAKLLEQKFRRQKLFVCESSDYERRKIQITEEIKNRKHFNESDFPDCEKILLKKFQLTDLEAESSDSNDDQVDSYVKESDNKPDRTSRFSDRRGPMRSFTNFSRPSFGIPMYPQTSKDTTPRSMFSPREFFDEATMRKQEQYIKEKFRKVFQNTVDDLRKELKDNQRNPEKHPKYSEEWKSFWIRRYKELISQSRDASSYDYKSEWIEFWMKKLRELYDAEIEIKRRDVRKRYLISNDEARKIEDEILSNLTPRSPSPKRRRSRSSNESSDDKSDDDENNRYRSYRDLSPEYEYEVINLVSVCRVLSVLVNELGMLAPKILDLFNRSVAMEKIAPNSCENLLYEDENMILMETAKEKLKGGLAAGLIQSHRIAPVKRAITYVAKLIHEVSRKIAVKKEGIPAKDIAKMEIARIICEALAAQGYTDVSTEELEELIKSFLNGNPIKIEKKKEKMEVEEPTNNFEKLTDDDLITLLRNFSELTSDEQNHLISYISKIEKTDLLRAVRLRKYLDMGDMVIDEDEMDVVMTEDKPAKNDESMIASSSKSSMLQKDANKISTANYTIQQPAYTTNEMTMQLELHNQQTDVINTQNY